MPEITAPTKAKGVVHHQIADTAKALCHAYWEDSARRSNDFFARFPNADWFVAQVWDQFVPIARSTLVDMLGKDFTPSGEPITEHMKQSIYDALKLDGAINARKVSKSNLLTKPSTLILPPKGKDSVH